MAASQGLEPSPGEWLRLPADAEVDARAHEIVHEVTLLEEYTVAELARRLDVGRRDLVRDCCSHLGRPPRDLIWWRRSARARRLLAAGWPPHAVAHDVAFRSSKALGAAFRRRGESLPALPKRGNGSPG